VNIQTTIWGSSEVVVRWKAKDEEPFNKVLFEGTEEECNEYIATCQVNKASDSSREGDL